MDDFIHLSSHKLHNRHILLLLIPILVFVTFAFIFFNNVNQTGKQAYSIEQNQAVLGEETSAK